MVFSVFPHPPTGNVNFMLYMVGGLCMSLLMRGINGLGMISVNEEDEWNILNILPEILEHIFTYLNNEELESFACTSKTAYNASEHILFRNIKIKSSSFNREDAATRNGVLENIRKYTVGLILQGDEIDEDDDTDNGDIKYIDLHGNLLTILKKCDSHRLRMLELHEFNMTQEAVQVINLFTNLQTLIFNSISIEQIACTNAWKSIFLNLANLTSLTLHSGVEISEADLTYISMLNSLQSLDVSWSDISAEGMAHICRIVSLEELCMHWCPNLDQKCLKDLHLLKSLKKIGLQGTDITQAEMSEVCKVLTLEDINLSQCRNLDDKCLVCLHFLKHLKKLNSSCTSIATVATSYICQISLLEELDLGECHKIDDNCLTDFHMLNHLKKLFLRGCWITTVGVSYICQVHTLEELDLSACSHLCDESFVDLYMLTSLKWLDVRFSKITSVAVFHICKVKSLQHLNLSCCCDVDDNSIAYLRTVNSLKSLCTLY